MHRLTRTRSLTFEQKRKRSFKAYPSVVYTQMVQLQKRLEREREMVGGGGGGGKEALAVCSNKSLGIGITMWDIESGDHLLHIPTCASSPHGLTCLGNQCLAASQIHRQGSVAGGVIFFWPFNKVIILILYLSFKACGLFLV